MKKQVVLLLSVLSLFTAQGQKIAIVGGLHSTSVSPLLNQSLNLKSYTETKRSSLHLGFIGSMPVTEKSKLFFQPGVLFFSRGTTHTQLLDVDNTDTMWLSTTQKIDYIDMPLNFICKLLLKGKTKFIFGGGPQASLFFKGSTNITTTDTLNKLKFKDDNDVAVGKNDQQFRVMHFGINALAGFEFGKVFLTFNYGKGLTPFYEQNGQSFKYTTVGASLGIYFNNKTLAVKKPVADNDRDKDGIIDIEDQCPDQAGSKLTHGCPDKDGDGIADINDHCPDVGGAKANYGCPVVLDDDHDGINNSEDKCPDIAGIAKYNGCPIPDADKDGISDEDDKCPNEAGVKENNGCPEVKKEVIEKVNSAARKIQFEYRKAELTAPSLKVLDEIVTTIMEHPGLNITIEGHSSTDGNSDANLKLSQQRADKVKKYFVLKGIDERLIKAIGYGAAKPLVVETDEQTRSINRRVEIKLSW